jgi:hypothetical protein
LNSLEPKFPVAEPPLQPAPARSRPPNQPTTLHQVHLRSQHAKLSGRAWYSTLPSGSFIASVNSNNICLLPLTIDQFGGIGRLLCAPASLQVYDMKWTEGAK